MRAGFGDQGDRSMIAHAERITRLVPLIPLVRHHRHHSDKGVIVLGILKDVLTVDATQHDVVDTRSA